MTSHHRCRSRRRTLPRVDPDAVRVGKDVIEILTTGMYVRPSRSTANTSRMPPTPSMPPARRRAWATGSEGGFDRVRPCGAARSRSAITAQALQQTDAPDPSCYRRFGKARHKRARLSRRRAAFGACLLPHAAIQDKSGRESKITSVTWDCRALRERLADSCVRAATFATRLLTA